MSVEERLAVVETMQKAGNLILKEIRDDVKVIVKGDAKQDLKIASLEQTRTTTRKLSGLLAIPILGTVLHTVLKAVNLY